MNRTIEKLKSILLVILFLSMIFFLFSYMDIKIKRADRSAVSSLPEEYLWVFSGGGKASITEIDKNMLLPRSVMLVMDYEGYAAVGNSNLISNLYKGLDSPLENIFSSDYLCRQSSETDWKSVLELKDFVMIDYGRPILYPIIPLFFGKSANETCQGDIEYIEKLILFSDNMGTLKAISKNSSGTYSSFTPIKSSQELPRFDFNSNNLAAYTVNAGFIEFSFNTASELDILGVTLPADYPVYKSNIPGKAIEVSSPLSILERINTQNYNESFKDASMSTLLSSFNVNPNITGAYFDGVSKLIFVNEYMRLETAASGNVIYSVSGSASDERAISIDTLIGISKDSYNFEETVTAAAIFIENLFDSMSLETKPCIAQVTKENGLICIDFIYMFEGIKVVNEQSQNDCAARLIFEGTNLVYASVNLLQITAHDMSVIQEENFLNFSVFQKAALSVYLSKFPDTEVNPMLAESIVISLDDFIPIYFVNANDICYAEWTAIER